MKFLRWIFLAAVGICTAGCSGVVKGTSGTDGSISIDGSVGSDGASDGRQVQADAGSVDGFVSDGSVFACDPGTASSPVLNGRLVFDPADPHPGDTVTVIVVSIALDRPSAPDMILEEEFSSGVRTWNVNHMAGGPATYYYAIPQVEPGDHCLMGKIGGMDEISARFTVTPRPAPPPRCNGGVFKVVTNHQWTCNEQPEWGNEIWIRTFDQTGQPMPGVTIRVGWPDTTMRPLYNETSAGLPPDTVQTDANGVFHGFNYWPTNENGYMVFNLFVDGCASDVASEITTGWWETDNDGCGFCNLPNRNVWGHWSHTVEFRLDTNAVQACVVPSDHAGHQGCAVEHIHHDPNHNACFDIP